MPINTSQKMFIGIVVGVVVIIAVTFLGFGKGNIAKNRDVTLTIWGVVDTQSDLQLTFTEFEAYLKSIPEYSRTNVKFNYRLWWEDEYEDLLLNQLAEGEGPDIFFIHNTWLQKHKGKLVPAPANIMTAETYQTTFAPVAYDDFVKDGQVFAMPLYVDTLALYYNVDHFRMADFSTVRPAITWDALQDQVTKLVIRDSSPTNLKRAGIAIGSSENISLATDILYLLFLQNDVKMCDEGCLNATFNVTNSNLDNGKELSTSSPAEKAMQYFGSFSNKEFAYYSWHPDYLTDLDLTYDRNEIDGFVEGKVSMIVGYADEYDEIEQRSERSNVVFEVAPIPQLYDPEETGYSVTYANYWAPSVSRFSPNWDVAWEFIKFSTSKEELNKYYNTTNRPTSRLDLIDFQKAVPRLQIWAEQVKDAKSLQLYDHKRFNEIFDKAITSVIDKEYSIDDAMDIAVDEVNKILFNYASIGE